MKLSVSYVFFKVFEFELFLQYFSSITVNTQSLSHLFGTDHCRVSVEGKDRLGLHAAIASAHAAAARMLQ